MAILIDKRIKHNLLPNKNMEIIDCLGVKIELENGPKIMVFSIYLPPITTTKDINDHYINNLDRIIVKYRRNNLLVLQIFKQSW